MDFGGKLRAPAKKKAAAKSANASASTSLIDKVLKIIEPPENPVDNDEAGLAEVVKALGTELPEDYPEILARTTEFEE